ncbi:histone-fold-containing protein [Cubamyces sp. BRFM 1775]|nr:histone-fold-containing protein [Cubamyces sp. BRFM 1775]
MSRSQARIKRIMQKDEEVGKVAQATPVVISKALELFLAMIVEEASNVTVERGSKRVEAYHLKHAIETVDMLDFLKEIVETVPDPSAGGTIDIEAENAEARGKKRGKGKDKKNAGDADGAEKPAPKRRRKKAADKEKEEEKEETGREMEVDEGHEEDEDEAANGERSRRDEDDEDWEG